MADTNQDTTERHGPTRSPLREETGDRRREPPFPTMLLGLPISYPSAKLVLQCLKPDDAQPHPRAHYLANVSYKTLLDAQNHEPFRHTLTGADYLFPTGLPARLAARWFGLSSRHWQTHWTVMKRLLNDAEENEKTVYLLGQKSSKTAKIRSRLQQRRPALKIVSERWIWQEEWTAKDTFALTKELRERRPDIILLSLTHIPAKIWMAENGRSLARHLVYDLGASEALFSRVVSIKAERRRFSWTARAKNSLLSLTRMNFSFLQRLWHFVYQLFAQRQALKTCQQATPAFPEHRPFPQKSMDGFLEITLPPRFDISFLRRFRNEWFKLVQARSGIILEGNGVRTFDMHALGTLLQLTQKLRQQGFNVVIQNPSLGLVRFLHQSKNPRSLLVRYDRNAAEDLARSSAWPDATSSDDSKAAIIWKGNVTAQTVDKIWEETTAEIKKREQTTQSFQVDLSRVTLLDSTGIGAMIKLKKRTTKQGYRLAFINPKQDIQKILEVTQLAEYLLKR